MGNSFTDAVGATVKKAKKTVETYSDAARELAGMPSKVENTVALQGPQDAYSRAEEARKKARK